MPRDIDFARTTDGVRIGFMMRGDGAPLVFASNAFGDAHFYRSLHPHTRRMMDGLAERGWRVVRYDLRGMGASDQDIASMSAEGLVRDLDAVVAALGFDRFALAGLHGGAATAIRYAAERPERVSELVLLNPFRSGAYPFVSDRVGRALTSVSSLAEDDFAFFSVVVANLMTNFANPEHARQLAETFQRSTSSSTLLAYQELLKRTDVTRLLPRLTAPTLVLHDTGFPFGSSEEREELARAIRGARFVVIPGDVEAEVAAIDSFLRSSRGQPPSDAASNLDPERSTILLTRREREVLGLVAAGMRTARSLSVWCSASAPCRDTSRTSTRSWGSGTGRRRLRSPSASRSGSAGVRGSRHERAGSGLEIRGSSDATGPRRCEAALAHAVEVRSKGARRGVLLDSDQRGRL